MIVSTCLQFLTPVSDVFIDRLFYSCPLVHHVHSYYGRKYYVYHGNTGNTQTSYSDALTALPTPSVINQQYVRVRYKEEKSGSLYSSSYFNNTLLNVSEYHASVFSVQIHQETQKNNRVSVRRQ